MMQRIQKIIANAGYCSRRNAEKLIEQGKVVVNGKIVSLGDKANINTDKIFVEGKLLKSTENEYFLLNKPVNYLTTLDDPKGRRTILDIMKKQGFKNRFIPIGRLDYDTEGMLLLTNDGDFANKVMHPRYEITKTYEVVIDKPFRKEDKLKLEKGIIILGRKTWPAEIKLFSKNSKILNITIHEGRNRIVKRMFNELSYKVVSLKRVAIGSLSIGKLKLGDIRKLSKKDIDLIFSKKNF